MSAQFLVPLAILFVAICAGLGMLGFRGRVSTVGIDLGTTFSVVGVNYGRGEVVIVADKQSQQRIFPSVVAYHDNGDISVAYDALPFLTTHPKHTIYNAKRFIGRSLVETDVQQYAAEHPFDVVAHKSNFSQVGFALPSGKIVTPEEVGAEVLKFLLKTTATFLGYNNVNKAVIAVPAKFSPEQRQATGDAYRKAGLKVVRVIEEPTAAAVAYKLHKKSDIHHILVYDFGGGTLDVSLLYVARGSVQVYATDGDETLGGSDFDVCLQKQILAQVEAESHSIIPHTLPNHSQDAQSSELCTVASIHVKAEEVKKRFSDQDQVLFTCTHPDSKQLISFPLQREQHFLLGCQDLFQRALLPVTRLLEQLEMSKDEVDEVVLVGGSTRIPEIKRLLRAFFGKELNDHIDPDVTVAYGAASILD